MRMARIGVSLLLLLAACGEEETAKAPPPAALDRSATVYLTGMIIVDHDGPKGQVHLESREVPLWFSNVRDTKAITMLPDEPKDIAAIYVHAIDKAKSWDHPGPEAWIAAESAFYVIGSGRRGGMGAPEPVPFSTRQAAEAFAKREGGRVVAWADIPEDFIFGDPHAQDGQGMASHDHAKDAKP